MAVRFWYGKQAGWSRWVGRAVENRVRTPRTCEPTRDPVRRSEAGDPAPALSAAPRTAPTRSDGPATATPPPRTVGRRGWSVLISLTKYQHKSARGSKTFPSARPRAIPRIPELAGAGPFQTSRTSSLFRPPLPLTFSYHRVRSSLVLLQASAGRGDSDEDSQVAS